MLFQNSYTATTQLQVNLILLRFERASVDIIRLEIEDIGSPTKLRVGHDGKGSRQSWFLERVSRVTRLRLYTGKTQRFVAVCKAIEYAPETLDEFERPR